MLVQRWFEIALARGLPEEIPACPYCCNPSVKVVRVWSGSNTIPYTSKIEKLFETRHSTMEELNLECQDCQLTIGHITTDDHPKMVIEEDAVKEDLRRHIGEPIHEYTARYNEYTARGIEPEFPPLGDVEFALFKRMYPNGNHSMVPERFQEYSDPVVPSLYTGDHE